MQTVALTFDQLDEMGSLNKNDFFKRILKIMTGVEKNINDNFAITAVFKKNGYVAMLTSVIEAFEFKVINIEKYNKAKVLAVFILKDVKKNTSQKLVIKLKQ